MIPYRDENETVRTPVITIAIIVINFAVWILIQGAGSEPALSTSVCNLGLIPGELTLLAKVGSGFSMGKGMACLMDAGRAPQHILYSMFLHGSWMHIIGNMWFFWLFGNNVEDAMGRGRFVIFYLLCGLAAAAAQVATSPASIVPMVGASGAISGVMGAYVVLYPRVRVFTLVPLGFFLTTVALPAWAMLGYWFALQLFSGVVQVGNAASGGVAVWAHAGGFITGAVLIKLFTRSEYMSQRTASQWSPRRMGFDKGRWQ
ncbi:MAG TPA: rhomboid family intramembrane serine protease [Gemmatimonadales bacterium]